VVAATGTVVFQNAGSNEGNIVLGKH